MIRNFCIAKGMFVFSIASLMKNKALREDHYKSILEKLFKTINISHKMYYESRNVLVIYSVNVNKVSN